MKRFPFKFTPLILCLILLCFALSVLCIVLNVIRFLNTASPSAYNIITLVSVLLISLAFIVLGISILISSYYEINDKFLIMKWGVLKHSIELKTINRLVKNPNTDKLSIYYNEDNYIVIVIRKEIFDDFTAALLRANDKMTLEILPIDERGE